MTDETIAEQIHYPGCWDTVAYPTLASALWEMLPEDRRHCDPYFCTHGDSQ
jgi:hypothetical protein